jgi:hypothetical protein
MAEHMQNGGQHRGGAGKHFRGQEEEEAQTRVVRPKPVRSVSDVYGENEGSRQRADQSYSHAAVPGAQTDWDPYTATGFGEAPHGHHHHHKSHRTLAIVLCIVAAVVVALGVSGYFFYRSAKTVAADASSLVSETTSFSKSLASGDTSSLEASAQKIEGLASSMEEETQSPLWSVATACLSSGPTSRRSVRLHLLPMISRRRS